MVNLRSAFAINWPLSRAIHLSRCEHKIQGITQGIDDNMKRRQRPCIGHRSSVGSLIINPKCRDGLGWARLSRPPPDRLALYVTK